MTDRRLESKLGFDRIREEISNHCSSEYALDRVSNEEFSTSREEIRRRLLLTDEMRLILMFEDNFPTTGYIDSIGFLTGLQKEGSSLDVLSLGKLKTLVDTGRKLVHFFSSMKDGIYPNLKKLSSGITVFPEIRQRIENILDRYGDIKDSASDELFTIRKNLRDKTASLSKRAGAILRKAQEEGLCDEDASVTIRDGKYLIPVDTRQKRKIQGFVFGESATGKTSYVEPSEIIDLENDIVELQYAQTREIARILLAFSDFVRPYLPELIRSSEITGEFDFIMAKAHTALDFIAGMPVISEDGTLSLRKARHPLLEKALRKEGRQICPLTVMLTPKKHILLISGPNAGGKSVCLKTTGLLQYMFQWGMLIPTSESSELPVFDRIIVSIGDDQSIENDLSTYSSFLSDMREMLRNATDKTLVLIDEFGSGTEPAAGGAIAEAILSEIDRRGVYGVLTTHYTNLKMYAAGDDTGVINGAMQFDSARIEPLFQLTIGLPGNSFAFELARKMNLPESIVKDAELRAGEEFVGIERNLRRIARNRRALDQKLQKIKATDKTLEGLTEKYEHELESIKAMKDDILDSARKEAESIVKGAGRQVEKTIREIRESQADKERTRSAREELQGFMAALEKKKVDDLRQKDQYLDRKLQQLKRRQERKGKEKPSERKDLAEPLKIGEKVRVKDNGMVGEVNKVSSGSVSLIMGNICTTVSPDRLERISSNEYKEVVKRTSTPVYQKQDASVTERKLNFSTTLDVRGMHLDEAMTTVMRYIDDSIMLGMGTVRILHGKGTGVLHDEIQKYIRTIPQVSSVTDEDIRHGGSGITVVNLE